MATEGGQAWRTRSDATAQEKGVGVLIDIEYLASENEDRSKNPYYIVVKGLRYYGSTPEAAVEAARESDAVKGSVKGEAIFMAQKQVSTALPSNRNRGRTMKNRAANAAGRAKAAAGSAKAAMGRGLNATRKFFTRAPKASGAVPAVNTASGPAKKGFFSRAANTARKSFASKGSTSSVAAAAPSTLGTSGPAKKGFLGRGTNAMRGILPKIKGYQNPNTAKPPAGAPLAPRPSETNTTPLLSPEA